MRDEVGLETRVVTVMVVGPLEDEINQYGENPKGNPELGAGPNPEIQNIQNPLARDFVAALTAANLLHPAPRDNTDNRAFAVMREFCRMNPPPFNRESRDPLVANH